MASGVPAVNLLPCRIRFATDKYLRPGLPRLRLRLRRKRPYHQCDLPRSLQLRNKRCFRTGQVTFVYRQLSVSSNVFSCNLILLAGTQTLGVFGFGQIGRRVAAMAHDGFGMKILAFDPFCKPESVPDYVALVSNRDEIFDNADFITLHMAATAENKHGIGAREFARMKKTACLINTARGSLVDEAALIEALRAGEIAGAGLDATEPEPADAASPLFRMENVIMTPHCGGSTKESKSRSSLGAAKGCDEVLTGKPITSPVL